MPKKSFSKIDDTEVKAVSIATLADRPNTSSTYGEGGLTAAQLKARFDAFPKLVQDKINKIIEVLSTSEAGMYIGLPDNTTGKDNLYDFVSLFNKDGRHENIADYIEMNFKDSSTPLASIINRLDATVVNHEAALSYIGTDLYHVKEKVSQFNSRISDNKVGVDSLRTKTRFLEKRVTNLESIVDSDLITIDSSTDYIKTVPARSASYAAITKFGGMSYKPENIITFERYSGSFGGGAWLTVLPDGSISVDNVAESTEEKVVSTFSLGVGTYYLSAIQTHPYTRVYLRKNGTLLVSLDGDDETYILSVDNATDEYSISIVVLAGGGFTMDRVKIMFHDFQGLRHAKPTAFKSVGANFIPYPYYENSHTHNGITYTINNDGTITANGTATNTSFFILALSIYLPEGEYTINSDTNLGFPAHMRWGNDVYDKTFTSTGEARDIEIRIDSGTTLNNVTFKPMLNRGDTALPYSPYKESTLAIPTKVLDKFDGYGIGRTYNFIDWSAKKYHKVYGAVDLGTLDWYYVTTGATRFQANIPSDAKPSVNDAVASNIICSKYTTGSANAVYAGEAGICFAETNIWVHDTNYTDAATFKEAMQGVMLVYEFATPEVTDISDILPVDNLIAVEGGGTIIVENKYGYDVPSEITYQLRSAT